jgi:hypothetical protein
MSHPDCCTRTICEVRISSTTREGAGNRCGLCNSAEGRVEGVVVEDETDGHFAEEGE